MNQKKLEVKRVETVHLVEMATGSQSTPVSQEQALLEAAFQCLGQFAFDKAKEKLLKERDTTKSSNPTSWNVMLNCMVHFCEAEKTYMSLLYLGQKWFTRKDTLRSTYQLLNTDLQKIEEPSPIYEAGVVSVSSLEKLLSHLCGQMRHFVIARMKMIEFYEQITVLGPMMGKQIQIEDLVKVIQDIIQSHQKNFHHPMLSPLKTSFSLECDTMYHLLYAQTNMAHGQFLTSLLHLHDANQKLASWGNANQAKEQAKQKLSFGTKMAALPALYQWMYKFKGVLVSKFSLYFFETLNKQAPPTEVKGIMSKASIDFYGRIVNFQKKADAINISLVFDVHGIDDLYTGQGYQHPQKFTEKFKGMENFPALFSYPGEKPSQHWPNVIMIMSDKWATDQNFDRILYFYDKKMQSTYFLTKLEPRITLVVIFDTKKAEKDTYIQNFLIEISGILRLNKIFTCLKPGAKG